MAWLFDGALVEVAGRAEEGFSDGWLRGQLVSRLSRSTWLVRLLDFQEAAERSAGSSADRVAETRLRPMPAQMEEPTSSFNEFPPGSHVDVRPVCRLFGKAAHSLVLRLC
jgi:hypothetical protein